MQEQKFEELEERSSLNLEEAEGTITRKLEAQRVIRNEIEAMRREDKVLLLAEEEERMLRAFRGFKARTKPGGVFKWQTRPDANVIAAPEVTLVRDAQDIS